MADNPRLTVRCEYPDTDLPPTEVTVRLSPSYGLATGHEANEWFPEMMREHEEFVVETDRVGGNATSRRRTMKRTLRGLTLLVSAHNRDSHPHRSEVVVFSVCPA